jgi:hypothetical protein
MNKILEMINTFSDDTEYTGEEVKELIRATVDYCNYEISNKDRLHEFHLRMIELKYKPKPFAK